MLFGSAFCWLEAKCKVLYSEDLEHKQKITGGAVFNKSTRKKGG